MIDLSRNQNQKPYKDDINDISYGALIGMTTMFVVIMLLIASLLGWL